MGSYLKSKKLIYLIVLILAFIYQAQLNNSGNPNIAPYEIKPSPQITQEIILDEEEFEEEGEMSDVVLGSEVEKPSLNRESARVVGIKDGDTIEVDIEGSRKIVRYIGIDTPESVDPRKPVQCYAAEASNINKTLVENQMVQLEKDVSETDKYGRLLRYVYLGDIFVNRYMVEEGFAYSKAYPPDVKYQEDLDAAEEGARLSNKGLWSACDASSSSSNSSTSTNSSVDKDCSDFSTHKEAQDYFISKGGSNINNIDKLDGSDRDGIVCETLP